jgi:membrane protease subunit HflC
MKQYILLPLGIIAILVFARLTFYTVDAAEYVYVTVLGQHRVTYDGANQDGGAGLKFGWPWPIEQVRRLDRRLQQFDLDPTEQLTHDADSNTVDKNLLIDAYVCWKIADKKPLDNLQDDPVDLFVRRIGTANRARDILAPEITGRLGAAIGQKRMDDFINTSIIDKATGQTKVDATVASLREELLASLKARFLEKYGIELVDIRLRRFNHPGSVRDSIFQRIKSERSKEATKYESEGKLKASNILSQAEESVRKDLAQARREEEIIKADTDTAAMKLRNQAYSQDPEFYEFLKKMEKLQAIVGSQETRLLLSTHRPMFESLFNAPRKKGDAPEKDKKTP